MSFRFAKIYKAIRRNEADAVTYRTSHKTHGYHELLDSTLTPGFTEGESEKGKSHKSPFHKTPEKQKTAKKTAPEQKPVTEKKTKSVKKEIPPKPSRDNVEIPNQSSKPSTPDEFVLDEIKIPMEKTAGEKPETEEVFEAVHSDGIPQLVEQSAEDETPHPIETNMPSTASSEMPEESTAQMMAELDALEGDLPEPDAVPGLENISLEEAKPDENATPEMDSFHRELDELAALQKAAEGDAPAEESQSLDSLLGELEEAADAKAMEESKALSADSETTIAENIDWSDPKAKKPVNAEAEPAVFSPEVLEFVAAIKQNRPGDTPDNPWLPPEQTMSMVEEAFKSFTGEEIQDILKKVQEGALDDLPGNLAYMAVQIQGSDIDDSEFSHANALPEEMEAQSRKDSHEPAAPTSAETDLRDMDEALITPEGIDVVPALSKKPVPANTSAGDSLEGLNGDEEMLKLLEKVESQKAQSPAPTAEGGPAIEEGDATDLEFLLGDAMAATRQMDKGGEEDSAMGEDPEKILKVLAQEQEASLQAQAEVAVDSARFELSQSQFQFLDEFISEMKLEKEDVYDGRIINAVLTKTEGLREEKFDDDGVAKVYEPKAYADNFLDFKIDDENLQEDPAVTKEKSEILRLETLYTILGSSSDVAEETRLDLSGLDLTKKVKTVEEIPVEAPKEPGFLSKLWKKLEPYYRLFHRFIIAPIANRLHHLDEYFPEVHESVVDWRKPKIAFKTFEDFTGLAALALLTYLIVEVSYWSYLKFLA